LKRAARLRRLPDFFELRLDCIGEELAANPGAVAQLRAPLIMTARHPAEGGRERLSAAQRRELLLRFLPLATYLDVEVRCVTALAPVLAAAKANSVQLILSVHHLEQCPTSAAMRRAFDEARQHGADIFKLAVRTDTPDQLSRLLAFFDAAADGPLPVSAMGIGTLGRAARVALARRGSALNYVHLGSAAVAGQLSLASMRRLLAR
jgi:3-dehydroquinate dehydratase-1